MKPDGYLMKAAPELIRAAITIQNAWRSHQTSKIRRKEEKKAVEKLKRCDWLANLDANNKTYYFHMDKRIFTYKKPEDYFEVIFEVDNYKKNILMAFASKYVKSRYILLIYL
jgi:hypothetical protein